MPAGVAVSVEDGVATVEFVDRSKAEAGLRALLAAAEPDPHVVDYRTSPSRYVVPEGVARKAGLLDEPNQAAGDEEKAPAEPPKGYDDGKPDMDWSRKDIDDYAGTLNPPLDVTGEKNKELAIAAIEEAIKGGAVPPAPQGE